MEDLARKWILKLKLDPSHGLAHHLSVVTNAKIICESELEGIPEAKYIREHVIVAAFIHDFIDHKYFTSSEISAIKKELYGEILEIKPHIDTDFIDIIIENISWSKRKEVAKKTFTPVQYKAIQIVREADWLLAIGPVGVVRCVLYSIHKLKIAPDDIESLKLALTKHYHEKLKLIENALELKKAREMAKNADTEVLVDHFAMHKHKGRWIPLCTPAECVDWF